MRAWPSDREAQADGSGKVGAGGGWIKPATDVFSGTGGACLFVMRNGRGWFLSFGEVDGVAAARFGPFPWT